MSETTAKGTSSTRHVGLVCRNCGCQHIYTVCTGRCNDGIVQRKRCQHCGAACRVFIGYEHCEDSPLNFSTA